MFRKQKNGKMIRRKVTCDCSNDEILTEQAHKQEVDINNIVKKHGIDLIQRTAMQKASADDYGDATGADFQTSMNMVLKAQESFDTLPAKVKKEFDNNPAKFLDFMHQPDNIEAMVDLGLVEKRQPDKPLEVFVTNVAEKQHEVDNGNDTRE